MRRMLFPSTGDSRRDLPAFSLSFFDVIDETRGRSRNENCDVELRFKHDRFQRSNSKRNLDVENGASFVRDAGKIWRGKRKEGIKLANRIFSDARNAVSEINVSIRRSR